MTPEKYWRFAHGTRKILEICSWYQKNIGNIAITTEKYWKFAHGTRKILEICSLHHRKSFYLCPSAIVCTLYPSASAGSFTWEFGFIAILFQIPPTENYSAMYGYQLVTDSLPAKRLHFSNSSF